MTESPKNTTTSVPVLIVGGGPAGLVTAITLARYGVDCLLVERREELSDEPRATAISLRSMELLRSWGLDSRVLEGALDVTFLGRYGETLTGPGSAIPLGLPTPEEAAEISPTAPACAPQDHLEPVLLRHLNSLRPATVRFGTELVDLEMTETGVLARIRGERLETVRARYLVGADGVRSRVRDALGVAMNGPGLVADGANALFRAPLWERIERPHYGLYPITHPEAEGVFVPAGRGDRWVYGYACGPRTLPPGAPDVGAMVARIRTASGIPELEPRMQRVGRFHYVAELAEHFRVGRAFLAGDAAHRITPRGGTGMNTAIRDGYDLGWKLAWVLRGWAGDELLDTYEEERRPVAAHNVRRSSDPNGSRRPVADELAVDLDGRIPHLWLRPGVSTLDLLGSGLTLFTGPHGDARQKTASSKRRGAPLTVRSLDEFTARGLGITGSGGLLVRPDGLPVDRAAALRRQAGVERYAA
jgi:2-polyprenyl-6-methoxyphenol hydroxylase-like FAD-dependent oxidoreductase